MFGNGLPVALQWRVRLPPSRTVVFEGANAITLSSVKQKKTIQKTYGFTDLYKKLIRKANRIRRKIHNVLLEISDLLSQVIVKSLRSLWTEPFQSRVPGFKKVSRKIAVQVQLLAQKCARIEENTQSFFALTLIRCQCVQTTIRYSNSTTVNSYQGNSA